MKYLTQKEFKQMMISSYREVRRQKGEINKINIFPVPDRDTGNNLLKTLLGIKQSIEQRKFNSLKEIFDAILKGALDFAQGNVGVIYTGFLAGFASAIQGNPVYHKIDAKSLAEAMEKGARRARASIQNPREGTILDVIDAATEAIKKLSKKEKDIAKLFREAIENAHQALLATREKMEIYRKANVVDAGGLGFLIILKAFLVSLEGGGGEKQKRIEEFSKKDRRFFQNPSHRYEIISLIKNSHLRKEEIKEKLKGLGNCLDIVRVADRIKIHIHTNYPEKVKDIMRSLGQIQSLKEEDMFKEIVSGFPLENRTIGLVTDETADLPPKIVERYQIAVVPYKVDWPEGERLAGENLYQKMKEAERKGIRKLPRTSQPSPKEFLEAYQRQLKKFERVLCIPLFSKVSGAYNSAVQAASMLKDPSRVYVFDSLQASAGQALLVLKAIELIQEKRKMEEIISELKRILPSIVIYGFLEDPAWLEWGGRINHFQANWLRRSQRWHFYPFLEFKKGVLNPMGGIVRAKDLPEAVFKLIEKRSRKFREKGGRIRIVISHCDNPKSAQELRERLKKIKAEIPFVVLTDRPLSVHTGPGSLIAAWMPINFSQSR